MLDALRRWFGQEETGVQQVNLRSPPPAASDAQVRDIIDAMARRQLAADALAQAEADLAAKLRQWGTRPVRLILSVPGAPIVTSPSPTPVNDVSFVIQVQEAEDAGGQFVEDLGPFTWTAEPASAVTSFGPDPASPQDGAARSQTVNVAPAVDGHQPDFTIPASDPSGATGSLACHPTAGGPTRLVLGVEISS